MKLGNRALVRLISILPPSLYWWLGLRQVDISGSYIARSEMFLRGD